MCCVSILGSLLLNTLVGLLVGAGLDLVLLVHRFTRTRIQENKITIGEHTLRVR